MSPNPNREFLQKSADLLVLSVLADGPQYGYAITKQISAKSAGSIRLTPGVLYPLLHELEQQGLLIASWETVQAAGNEDEEKGRKRKWYRLSAKGNKRLTQRIDAHRAYQSMIESFIPKAQGSESA